MSFSISMRLTRARRTLVLFPALSIALLFSACNARDAADKAAGVRYEATLVRTEYGIAHISAESWGSLGFGEAYAAAEDHVCNMALALLQARAESASAFGPGDNKRNTARDIVIKALDIPRRASVALSRQKADIREWLEGYAAGYNRYLDEHPGGVGSWCNDAEWVRPVSAAEFMAQYLMLVHTLPRVAGAITAAAIPEASARSAAATGSETPELALTLSELERHDMGSNAWALAGARTENGRGLLLANPHYPWYGSARFWEKHLTIPGVYDAYGVGLIGMPGVIIGFNRSVGWSHTVSHSKRTVIYRLSLNPENPREYRWEDAWRALSPVEVTVEVASAAGRDTVSHTVWFSHHGPLMALAGLSDDPFTVFAVRDANADNIHSLAQWQAMAQAEDMDAFIDAHRQYNAMPWVNTVAAGASGRAVYLDNSNVAALSEDSLQRWREQIAADPRRHYLYLSQGLIVLDGSQRAHEWLDSGAPVPYTEPFERRPLIESEQYVFNANDSYWLSDPARPAAALSPLYGPTNSPRSLRTRMNIELLRPDSPFAYAGQDGKFSIEEVQRALFGNDSLSARLLLPELLQACALQPERTVKNALVDLSNACAVLGAWDRKFNLDSRGAVLFREWITRYPYADTYLGQGLFKAPFDPLAPAATPRGLADANTALNKLAEATQLLTAAGIPLDVALGEHQVGHRSHRVIPVHGGNRHEGIANLQMSTSRYHNPTETPIFTGRDDYIGDSENLSSSGYNVVHGSSFIMTLNFTEAGPNAEAILSYSQSGDPDSAHFADQTPLYKDKIWRKILFTPTDIAEHTLSKTVLRSAP